MRSHTYTRRRTRMQTDNRVGGIRVVAAVHRSVYAAYCTRVHDDGSSDGTRCCVMTSREKEMCFRKNDDEDCEWSVEHEKSSENGIGNTAEGLERVEKKK